MANDDGRPEFGKDLATKVAELRAAATAEAAALSRMIEHEHSIIVTTALAEDRHDLHRSRELARRGR